MTQKELDYAFIKQFKTISIMNVCTDLHLQKDYGNIINGTASEKKIKKVRKEIERRLAIINENN
jgi:spore cortex formation protein SpoVR/YcgB (stage V sporulation)